MTAYLESLGLEFHEGHDGGTRRRRGRGGALVSGEAVEPGSAGSERRDIPVILRGAAPRGSDGARRGIAIAGAHGKTTTTAMLGLVLDGAGIDPTVVIGGRFAAFGSHARVGRSEFLVAEADESDRSFLCCGRRLPW